MRTRSYFALRLTLVVVILVALFVLFGWWVSRSRAQFATPPDSSTVAGWQFATFTDVDDSLTAGYQIYQKIDTTDAVIDSAVGAERAAVAASVDEVASSVWAGRVSDETGTGLWTFATSPTFTTDITSPLVIGGTAVSSDLSFKTTSGVGESGADMHFLVGNNGATEAVTILNNGYVGIGINSPSSILHVKANTPGTVGSHPAGQLIIQNPTNSVYANAVITGYESDGDGNPDQQLWYLGGSSGSSSDVTLLNRRNSKLHLGANGATKMTILGDGNVGIGTLNPPERLSVVGNIATGDSTTGDVDVFHYFSTDASWTTEYLKWDDGLSQFMISDDIDVTGNITMPDDGWIGLGSAKGRIDFLDETLDTVRIWGGALRTQYIYTTTISTISTAIIGNGLTVTAGLVDLTGTTINLPSNAVDASAEIATQIILSDHIDSTDEAFVFSDAYHVTSEIGDSAYVSRKEMRGRDQVKSFVIQAIDSDHDIKLWKTPVAITIDSVFGQCTAGTNVIGALDEYDWDNTDLVAIVNADWTFTTTYQAVGSFTNAGIAAKNHLKWHTTSVSGTVNFFDLTIWYHED